MSKAKTPTTSPSTGTKIQPKVFMRGSQEFRHDLFKLEAADFMKNISWVSKAPNLIKMPHAHVFHSHNDRGQLNKYSTAVGGHFHEVAMKMLPDGSIVAECGPALKEVKRKTSQGKVKTTIEPVRFDDEETGVTVDGHTHPATYLGSEVLSASHIQQIRSQNQSYVQSLQSPPTPNPVSSSSHVEGFEDLDA